MNNLFLNLYVKFQILMDSEDGQDMIEYALAVALIAFAATASTRALASGISTSYNHISTKLAANIS
jgi:pilus assembly protein Flp/PilA